MVGIPALWDWPQHASRNAINGLVLFSPAIRKPVSPTAPADRSPESISERHRSALEAGVIVKGGGHAMAAGITVEIAKLVEFRSFLEEKLASAVLNAAENALLIDGALTASGATLELIELLEQAGPYGSAHPAPVFAFPAHRVVYADPAGSDHIRCTLASADGTKSRPSPSAPWAPTLAKRSSPSVNCPCISPAA